MAGQIVHNVTHLAISEVDLSDFKEDLIILPALAELISLSVEVLEVSDAGVKLDLGFEGQRSVLADNVDLSIAGVNVANVALTLSKAEVLKAQITGTAQKGKFKVRCQYFYPSTILMEYGGL